MALTPNKYQKEAFKTFIVDGIRKLFLLNEKPTFEEFDEEMARVAFAKLTYSTLGLTGESGEFAEEVKKAIREGGVISQERRDDMLAELGDVLWYAAAAATCLGATLEDIMEKNLGKVRAKHAKVMREQHGITKK